MILENSQCVIKLFYKVIKHEILQMELKPSQRPLMENDITMQN